MNLKKLRLAPTDTFFLKMYLLLLAFFALFRIFFVIRYHGQYSGVPFGDILTAFFYGARFDTVIIGYYLAPFFLIGHIPYIGIEFSKIMRITVQVLMLILLIVYTGAMIGNLEFFEEYNSHLDYTSIEYSDTPDLIVYTIWNEYPVIPYLFLMFLVVGSFGYLQHRLFKKLQYKKTHYINRSVTFLILAGLLFLGVRGRTGTASINWGVGFTSQYNIANQTAVNPIFNFIRDVYDHEKRPQYISDKEAIEVTKEIIMPNEEPIVKEYPFFREFKTDEPQKKMNVVLILLESFSAEFVGCLGSDLGLTPNFDKLSEDGVLFTNFYSNGQRSARAFNTSYCSYPVLTGKSLIKQVQAQQKIPSISQMLKDSGYSTHFIYGGDIEFDNMRGFLVSKGVDNFVGQTDFDPDTFINKWGAPDHVVFERTIEEIDKLPADKPFFLSVFSTTNHPPYTIPDVDFGKVETGGELNGNYNTFKYMDYALGQFFDKIKGKPYFNNTLFIVTGDHSKNYHHDIPFDHRASYVPCLFYSPGNLAPARYDYVTSQVDIPPTLLNYLHISARHSFFGKDMLNGNPDNRFALIVKHNNIGWLEDKYFFSGKIGQGSQLYNLENEKFIDIKNAEKELHDRLQRKAYSMEQAVFYLFKKRRIAF